jgi:nicotinate-nucleotide adenylyltransferase
MTETNYKKAIGILGGTFNPIHHGHLRLAIELYERLDLAEVRLLPVGQPPHREQPTISNEYRLEMVQAAIIGVTGLSVDDRELRRKGPSYMVDTLSSLRKDFPQRPLCLILGMDAFLDLPQWYQWERLITLAHILVVNRINSQLYDNQIMQNFLKKHRILKKEELQIEKSGKIWVEEILILDISSTQIRNIIAAGKNPNYLLPPAVLEKINSYHFYH